MKKLLLTLFILFHSLTYSQEIFIFNGHEVEVESVESYEVLDKYTRILEEYPVSFEQNFRKINRITLNNSEFKNDIASLEDGTIYLNPRLEEHPNLKKAIVLHYLLITNGFKPKKTPFLHILNDDIHISSANEQYFSKLFKNNLIYSWVVRESKKVAPLESKL
jgi:hypothetical protein